MAEPRDDRTRLAAEIEALMADAYPTPWVERPQELDDWGVIRTTVTDEDGFHPVACVARGDDDQAEQSLARQEGRQPKRIGANSALIAKVLGNLPTILAALRSPGLDRHGERMRERCARACDARALGCKTAAQEWVEGSVNFPPQPEIAHAFMTAADQCRQLAEIVRTLPLAHEEKAGC